MSKAVRVRRQVSRKPLIVRFLSPQTPVTAALDKYSRVFGRICGVKTRLWKLFFFLETLAVLTGLL
jgi:hypothetical protein